MPYCTSTGRSSPYSLSSAACRVASDAALAGHCLDRVAGDDADQEERQQRHPDERRNDEADAGEEEAQHGGRWPEQAGIEPQIQRLASPTPPSCAPMRAH